MSNKQVLIQADATNEYGLGMVSSANSIAEELATRNYEVTIITNAPLGEKYFKNSLHNIVIKPEGSGKEQLSEILDKNSFNECLLLLTSAVDSELYFNKLNPSKIVLIKESFIDNIKIPIDLFISSIQVKEPKNVNLKKSLVGPKYHFIKKAILKSPKAVIKKHIGSVLLTMGGADNKEITLALMSMLYAVLEDCQHTVLLGTCNKRVGFTEKRLLGISDDIEINRNVKRVEHRYPKFDLALGKGGVTSYELMYLGVPQILISTNENQRSLLEYLQKEGVICYAGHWNEIKEDNIVNAVNAFMNSIELRQSLSAKSKELIDGLGIQRIADAIESL
ncbi:MAG: hypothetical protein COA79_05005 [Planctomycetota bacterium]|nr:MAG: hypothetical protein COA79_05005 [Planctomycetota bacterium]